MLGQEALGALDTALGKCLVVFVGAPWIGMALENQLAGFAFEIFLEIIGQRDKRLPLAEKQACQGICGRGLGRGEVDAVEGEP